MRTSTSRASSDEEHALDPFLQYCLPRHVTVAGRRAFHDEVRIYAAQLAEQIRITAQRAHHAEPVYTASDVHDAARTVDRQHAPRADRPDHRVLAAILLTVGTLGISCLANVLVGPWQVLAFAVFVAVAVAGLVLTWTGRSRTPPRGEP